MSSPVITLRPATGADTGPLTTLLAESFFDDALTVWAFPNPRRRQQILPGFFRIFLDLSISQEGALTTEDRQAVVLSTPPGAEDPGADFTTRLREVAGEYADALLTIVRLQEAHHPAAPRHLYLGFGAVAPHLQRSGLGAQMMRQVLDGCDRDGVPAYLEASSPGGEAVARRFGFEHHGPEIVMPGGPRLRPMWRDPYVL
ncbi:MULTISPECIES: GNAT family N-acetyltransferase [Streptosporangium]|uniref:GNAT superfamily N-acetyltransferase n=1 Tax=Streptosporangium brasiliense TaxID=47480 RepID=A0ABT9R4N0_9ACTN|nr:GNAT family N-acetyltransferase [Streptosporangium brasiliense]MDP9864189.1 GNAT superfamily N-acetyltransferase [Streptosporangium brasiliense]